MLLSVTRASWTRRAADLHQVPCLVPNQRRDDYAGLNEYMPDSTTSYIKLLRWVWRCRAEETTAAADKPCLVRKGSPRKAFNDLTRREGLWPDKERIRDSCQFAEVRLKTSHWRSRYYVKPKRIDLTSRPLSAVCLYTRDGATSSDRRITKPNHPSGMGPFRPGLVGSMYSVQHVRGNHNVYRQLYICTELSTARFSSA